MKTIEDPFFKYAEKATSVVYEQESAFVEYCSIFSSVASGSFYVLDILKKRFCYIDSNDFFLCGHSVEEAIEFGYDFYSRIIHPDDLPLWVDILKIIKQYLKKHKEKWSQIYYFSCTFRLLRKYSFMPRPLSQMIYQKMKPIWIENKLRYLVCTIESSTNNKPGDLCLHDNSGLICEKYSFTARRWQLSTRELLTERERAILILVQQGKNAKDIADELCKGFNTIRNQMKQIIEKLNVHSITEAANVAAKHRMLYISKQILSELEQPCMEPFCKKKRILITENMMLRIQWYLNNGLSIRKVAKIVGLSESAIRYWKNKKKLK